MNFIDEARYFIGTLVNELNSAKTLLAGHRSRLDLDPLQAFKSVEPAIQGAAAYSIYKPLVDQIVVLAPDYYRSGQYYLLGRLEITALPQFCDLLRKTRTDLNDRAVGQFSTGATLMQIATDLAVHNVATKVSADITAFLAKAQMP